MFKIVFFYFRESHFLFAMPDTYEDTTGFCPEERKLAATIYYFKSFTLF